MQYFEISVFGITGVDYVNISVPSITVSIPELQIRGDIEDNSKTIFSYFSPKTYVVTLH